MAQLFLFEGGGAEDLPSEKKNNSCKNLPNLYKKELSEKKKQKTL
jgi:hypothetical protein